MYCEQGYGLASRRGSRPSLVSFSTVRVQTAHFSSWTVLNRGRPQNQEWIPSFARLNGPLTLGARRTVVCGRPRWRKCPQRSRRPFAAFPFRRHQIDPHRSLPGAQPTLPLFVVPTQKLQGLQIAPRCLWWIVLLWSCCFLSLVSPSFPLYSVADTTRAPVRV